MHDAGVYGRREQVVSSTHRVDVTGEVQVEVLHGDYLGIAATCRATLDAEGWALRRLPDHREHLLADVVEPLAHSNSRHGLAFPQRGRRDGRDVYILAVGPVLEPLDNVKVDLVLVLAIQTQMVLG